MQKEILFTYPHTQDLFYTLLIKTDTQVNGLVNHLTILPNLKDYTIHPHDQVNTLQQTILPFHRGLGNFARYDGYSRYRQGYSIDFFHFLLNI